MSEYKDALEAFDEWAKNMPQFPFKCEIELVRHVDSVRRALLIADRIEDDRPSQGMVDGKARDILLEYSLGKGNKTSALFSIWRAMVAKLKEEIGIDDKNAS